MIFRFDARKNRIIEVLLKSNEPVTGKYLADITGVTPRTIRNDIKYLNHELEVDGVEIISIPGKGYSIQLNSKGLGKSLQDFMEEHIENGGYVFPTLPEERVHFIIKKLICAVDFLTLQELADELYVSKSTINNDVIRAEKLLSKYHLKVLKKPNYGLILQGDEINLRSCILDIFFNSRDGSNDILDKDLEYFLHDINIERINQILLEYLKEMPLKISDIAYRNLVIYIAIAIERIRLGKGIEKNFKEIEELRTKEEYKLAGRMIKEFENYFDIVIPESEIAYITMHLLGTQNIESGILKVQELESLIGDKLLSVVKKMIYEVANVYKIDFTDDEDLVLGLGMHLKLALNRFKYGLNLENPLLKEIIEEYPNAFEIALVASKVLSEEFEIEIDKNEIGYLAMHFGAAIERKNNERRRAIKRIAIVCASGMGTARLLATKIKRVIDDVVITGIYPSYKISDIDLQNTDLILSTVPIDSNLGVPLVHVSSLLNERDVTEIQKVAMNFWRLDTCSYKEEFLTYFKEELFIKDIDSDDKTEIIELLCYILLKNGYVQDDYEESVFQREAISPTAVGNFVAIPHPVMSNQKGSHIAVGILKKPIDWRNEKVRLVFMLALEHIDYESSENIFSEFYGMISNEKFIFELIDSKDYTDFIKKIKNWMQ